MKPFWLNFIDRFCLSLIISIPRQYLTSPRLEICKSLFSLLYRLVISSNFLENTRISSIYVANITSLLLLIKIELSAGIGLKPSVASILVQWICHCLADCFSPYKALFSLQTRLGSLIYPVGCSIYRSVSISALGKADLTSHWCISQSR